MRVEEGMGAEDINNVNDDFSFQASFEALQ